MTQKITREIRLQKWLEDIKSFKESGLSQNQWCEINDISKSTFRYRCQIVEKEITQRQLSNINANEVQQSEFVQVPIEKYQEQVTLEEKPSNDNIVIELSRAKITMPISISPKQISALLQAVSNV